MLQSLYNTSHWFMHHYEHQTQILLFLSKNRFEKWHITLNVIAFVFQTCSHIWTSKNAYGHFNLRSVSDNGIAYAFCFMLETQRCNECKLESRVSATWYPHVVIKVSLLSLKPKNFIGFWHSSIREYDLTLCSFISKNNSSSTIHYYFLTT